MSVQPNEALREARDRVAELEAEVEKLRKRSPRTKIEGVECVCVREDGGVSAEGREWYVGWDPRGGGVDLGVLGIGANLTPDDAELIASKLMWCARAARGEDV